MCPNLYGIDCVFKSGISCCADIDSTGSRNMYTYVVIGILNSHEKEFESFKNLEDAIRLLRVKVREQQDYLIPAIIEIKLA